SCTIGKIGSTNNLTVERTSTIKHLRLDMDILCRISREIVNQKGIKKYLLYRSNSSIYISSNKIKYFEYKYSKTGRRNFHLSGSENNTILKKIIAFSQEYKSFKQISDYIILKHPEYEVEEINTYIQELIDNNILLSNLEPNVTG